MKFPIPETLLASHMAALGKTRSGKTSTTKLVVEHVASEGYRVCVLDTIKSDWWGIISSASGKKPGLPFTILGGPRGHLPLHSGAGKAIGELVAKGKIPLSVLDMADFEPGGLQRFFADFAQALWKNIRGVLYLVIEEAHEVAPKEVAGFGGESMAIHWAKKLATGGGSKGIRLIVATQRTQALHNAVLGSCETIFAHRLTAPADQKPVLDWLKANVGDKEKQAEIASSMASLPTGTAWVCSGEARYFEKVAFPKFDTFDNSKTPEKDAAEVAVTSATVDQDELRAIIGDAVKDAEANDPKKLHAEIAKLKREALSQKPASSEAAKVDTTAIEAAADRRGYERGAAEGFQTGYDVAVLATIDSIRAIQREPTPNHPIYGSPSIHQSGQQPATPPVPARLCGHHPPERAAMPVSRAPAAQGAGSAAGTFSGPENLVLGSLSQWAAYGKTEITEAQMSFLARYSHTSTSYKKARGALAVGGFIAKAGGLYSLTAEGQRVAPPPDTSKTIRDQVRAMISGVEQLLFDALIRYPSGLQDDDLAAESNYSPTSTSYKKARGHLSTLTVLTKTAGIFTLADWVML